VKLEQASKVKLWMPTPLRLGEGRAGREETDKHLFRSAGVVSTACREGDLSQWGIPGAGGGRAFQRGPKGQRSVWESERVIGPLRPGNAGGGKDPYFWCAWEGGKVR
jgi:hypothetical protein